MVKVDRHNIDAPKPSESDKGIFVTIFTDGSFCPKTSAWGVGIWLRYSEEQPIEMSTGGIGEHSDIYRVELYGLTQALDYLIENYDITDKVIVFQCDNIGAVKAAYDQYNNKLLQAGAKFVKAKHVKGHSGKQTSRSRVNQIVDKLAGDQMRTYRSMYNGKV